MAPRALHWVFKIAQRERTMRFFTELLGMQVLRHEEFKKGCEAACNGPYDGAWSKTMVGYGPEDSHFVVELTYNYGIKEYVQGNDYQFITIRSKAAYGRAVTMAAEFPTTNGPSIDSLFVRAPGGYNFLLINSDQDGDPVVAVRLSTVDIAAAKKYWHGLLKMKVESEATDLLTLSYDANQAKLELAQVGSIDRGTAFGRIAFARPGDEIQPLEEEVKAAGYQVLVPYVSLDTPGKATVRVVILLDPSGHEICFVDEEGFRELSQVDPQGGKLLAEAIAADNSDEYFAKKAQRAKERAAAAAAAAAAPATGAPASS